MGSILAPYSGRPSPQDLFLGRSLQRGVWEDLLGESYLLTLDCATVGKGALERGFTKGFLDREPFFNF